MKERERERERNKGRYFQIDTVVNTEGRGGVPNYKYANSTVFIQRQRKNYQTRPHQLLYHSHLHFGTVLPSLHFLAFQATPKKIIEEKASGFFQLSL